MQLNGSLGMVMLAIGLLVLGFGMLVGFAVPGVVVGIWAILTGLLILIGR